MSTARPSGGRSVGLKVKLVAPSVIVAALLLVAAAVLLLRTRAQARVEATYVAHNEDLRALDRLVERLAAIQSRLYRSVSLSLAGLDAVEVKARMDENLRDLDRALAELGQQVETWEESPPGQRKAMVAAGQLFRKWVAEVGDYADDPGVAASNMVTVEKKFEALKVFLAAAQEARSAAIRAAAEETSAALATTTRIQIAIFAAVLAVAFGLGLRNARSILGSVRRTVEGVKVIAGGDLGTPLVAETQDELGELAAVVDQMRLRLREVLASVQGAAGDLHTSSDSFSAAAGRLTASAAPLAAGTDQIVEASGEARRGAADMARATTEVSHGTGEVTRALEQMQATVAEIARSCHHELEIATSAREKAGQVMGSIDALGRASGDIAEALRIINTIAGRTRLLALNATIEAARAGASGRGFTVVATEIKDLAGQSAQAAARIATTVSDVQAKIGATTRSVREIGKVIQDVADSSGVIAAAVEEQSATSRAIAQSLSEVSLGSARLVDSASASDRRSAEILTAVEQVRAVTSEASHHAKDVAAGARNLNEMASALHALAGQFHL